MLGTLFNLVSRSTSGAVSTLATPPAPLSAAVPTPVQATALENVTPPRAQRAKLAAHFADIASLLRHHGVLPLSRTSRLIVDEPVNIAADITRDLHDSRNVPLIATIGRLAKGFQEIFSVIAAGDLSIVIRDRRQELALQLGHVFALVMEDPALVRAYQHFAYRRGMLGAAVSFTVVSPFLEALLGEIPHSVGAPKFPWYKLQTKAAKELLANYQKHLPELAGLSLPEISRLDEKRSLAEDLGRATVRKHNGYVADPVFREGAGSILTGYENVARNIAATELFNRVAELNPDALEVMVTGTANGFLQNKPEDLRDRITDNVLDTLNTRLAGQWSTVRRGRGARHPFWLQNEIIRCVAGEPAKLATIAPDLFESAIAQSVDPNSGLSMSLHKAIGREVDIAERSVTRQIAKEERARIEKERSEEAWSSYRRDLKARLVDMLQRRGVPQNSQFFIFDSYTHSRGFINDALSLRDLVREIPEIGVKVRYFAPYDDGSPVSFIRRTVTEAMRKSHNGESPVAGVAVGSRDDVHAFSRRAYRVWPHVKDQYGNFALQLHTSSLFLNLSLICAQSTDVPIFYQPLKVYPSVSYSDQFIAWFTGDLKSIAGEPMRQGVALFESLRRFTGAELRYLSELELDRD